MKKIATLLFSMMVASSAFAADGPILIKFSHTVKDNTPKGMAALKFKELAEKYTNGKVKVEVGSASKMALQRDEMAFLKDNKIQMIAPALGILDKAFKDPKDNPHAVLAMPYLFEDTAQFSKFANSPVAQDMAKSLDNTPYQILGIWDNGMKFLSSNKALRTPDDIKNVTFRIQPSGMERAQFRAWGALPRVLSFGDMYSGLLYGTVNGAENPPSNFQAQRLHEVQKYLYTTNHSYLGYGWLVNRDFWSKLPADVKAQIDRAIKETNTFANGSADDDNSFALQAIRATGMTRVEAPTPELVQYLKAQSKEVEKLLSPLQQSILPKVRAAVQ